MTEDGKIAWWKDWWLGKVLAPILVLIIGGVIFGKDLRGCGSSGSAVPTEAKEPSYFSGIVRRANGDGIARATVHVSLDQLPSQSLICDSSGNFHVDVPSSIRSLHLTASASGYVTKDVDTRPVRTGPEIIVLDAIQP